MKKYQVGMVGLGVMGRNLLLNMADHGFSVAGLDRDASQVQALLHEGKGKDVTATSNVEAFVGQLSKPRAVFLLVPAGEAVDAVIREFLPVLEPGDLIIDAGNSHFKDTDARGKFLKDKGIHFFGMGVSGGEEGARRGPSIMPGGPKEAFEVVRPILEAIAAKAKGESCVSYLGPGSAGHYVKMVHNGIEYGLMELIAESYDCMRRGLRLSNDEIAEVYSEWNKSELGSYLLEISSEIFLKHDEKSGKRLIDVVQDVARQKGTGRWTSQDAMDIQVPIPTIDAAVAMRELSSYEVERVTASQFLKGPNHEFVGSEAAFLDELKHALYFGMVVTFAQGMTQLAQASESLGYHLSLESVAKVWRGGCIIRAKVLEDIQAAYHRQSNLLNLLLDPVLGDAVMNRQSSMRQVIGSAVMLGIPIPGFMSALAYYDGLRSSRLPSNLVQAQRDYFGAHTYERIDEKGTFHSLWNRSVSLH